MKKRNAERGERDSKGEPQDRVHQTLQVFWLCKTSTEEKGTFKTAGRRAEFGRSSWREKGKPWRGEEDRGRVLQEEASYTRLPHLGNRFKSRG